MIHSWSSLQDAKLLSSTNYHIGSGHMGGSLWPQVTPHRDATIILRLGLARKIDFDTLEQIM